MRARMVVLALAVACGACGGGDSATPRVPAAGRAHAGLCRAGEAAARGDVSTVRQLFFDDAHDALHDLAARVEQDDRAAAARLLEATQHVEAELRNHEMGDAAGDLEPRVDALAEATRRAIVAAGDDAPAPCPRQR